MSATPKPTFIHLGPLHLRRSHYIGVRARTNGNLEVMIEADGCGIYSQYLKNDDDIKDFWEDFNRHQSKGRL